MRTEKLTFLEQIVLAIDSRISLYPETVKDFGPFITVLINARARIVSDREKMRRVVGNCKAWAEAYNECQPNMSFNTMMEVIQKDLS